MITALTRLRGRLAADFDRPSSLVKQTATVAGVLVALIVLWLFPEISVTDSGSFAVSLILILAGTILAGVCTRSARVDRFALLIPAVDIIALGFFRAGTGGTTSVFAALIILPVVWIASGDGRRYIAFAGIGTCIALLLPFALGITEPNGRTDILRALFSPAVFTLAAAIVNELARQGRAQIVAIKALADEKEEILQRTFDYAAELQDSERKFRAGARMFRGVWAAVTEQSVIGTDATGIIDAWNPGATKLLGPSADEAEYKRGIYEFHLESELDDHARDLNYPPGETVLNPGFSALVERARLGEAEVREWTYVRSDGTHLPVEVSVTKRVDETGETAGYLFVATDLTKAREVTRLKDEFVGLISHELRTPLSSILGYLELMRDDEEHPLSKEHLQYLGVAERNAKRLLHLVGDLLFTAQVESGKFPLNWSDLELHEIVSAAVESAGPTAGAAGVHLVAELSDSVVSVSGDPLRLAQAVDNLVSNAIKFTPRGGSVTVTLAQREERAVVSVRDTGIGIPAEEMEKLFSRFFRATTATKNAVPGVGLGLVITKAIVIAHNGEMDVSSEEGVGTEFSLALPLLHAVAAPVAH